MWRVLIDLVAVRSANRHGPTASWRLTANEHIMYQRVTILVGAVTTVAVVVSSSVVASRVAFEQRTSRDVDELFAARPVTVRLKQEGMFRLGADKSWLPFTAAEYYTTDPPGYVWTVSIRMAPLLSIVGRDRYINGRADIDRQLLSLLPVASSRGSGWTKGRFCAT